MGFGFRKIYADLLADDGTLYVAYLAWVNAWGGRLAFGGLERYSPDGSRRVLRARPLVPAQFPLCAGPGRPLELGLAFDDGDLVLRYQPALPSWDPGPVTGSPGISWSVAVPRGEASACWSDSEGTTAMDGTGYVDCVELTRVPPLLRLRRLDWGRIHLPGGTAIFTAIRTRPGRHWQRAAWWPAGSGPAGQPQVVDRFELVPQADGTSLTLDPPGGSGPREILMRPARVLHHGQALDPGRSPSRLERWGLRLAAGRITETRWISHTVSSDCDPSRHGWAVHESVDFGQPRQDGTTTMEPAECG
jgi:hypothetical protein